MFELLGKRKKFSFTGGPGVGIFSGGNAGSVVNYTDKYAYANDTVSVGASLITPTNYGAAAGNSSVGIFAAGYVSGSVSNIVNLYSHIDGAVIAGTNLAVARYDLAAIASNTTAYFNGGWGASGGYSAHTDKYNCSTNAVVAGSLLASSKYTHTGVSSTIFGLFVGGYAWGHLNAIEKYTYSGDTVTAGTNLSVARGNLAGAGNTEFCVISGGDVSGDVVDKYIYSNNTMVSSVMLKTSAKFLAATGNNNIALFGGGMADSSRLKSTYKYGYSADAIAPGTSLGLNRADLSACSSSPGGF